MNIKLPVAFTALLLPMLLGSAVLADSLPSYQADLKAFKSAQRSTAGPKLDFSDRVIMQAAKEDLARAMPDPGLKVGERAPGFSLPNAHGEVRSLAEFLQKGPVVLVFYRGAWCPYCNLQLNGLQRSAPAFAEAGAALVAITPQQPDRSLQQVKKNGYPFEILSDLDNAVMRAYRLLFEVPAELSDVYKRKLSLDLADYNGAGRYVLPVPGTYVIDRQGVVRAAWADTDYTWRVEPADILAALQRLDKTTAE